MVKKRLHTVFILPNEQRTFEKKQAREYENKSIKDEKKRDASTVIDVI